MQPSVINCNVFVYSKYHFKTLDKSDKRVLSSSNSAEALIVNSVGHDCIIILQCFGYFWPSMSTFQSAHLSQSNPYEIECPEVRNGVDHGLITSIVSL